MEGCIPVIVIRRVFPADADDALLNEVNRLLPQHTASRGPLAMEEFREALADPHFHFFIARDAETSKVVGMGSIFFQRNLVRWFAEIHDIAVDGEARGRGIGRAIVEKLIATAAEFAALRNQPIPVSLTSNPSRVAANALYTKMGFLLVAAAEGARGTNLYRLTVDPS
jgi:ribosomal protein S18 acetylase RimI-like enzyme